MPPPQQRKLESFLCLASTRKDNNTMKFEDSRDAIFHDQFVEDLQYFVLNNGKIAEKILKLVKLSKRDPFKGEGNPKRLKHLGSGVVSRRITQEHRLVYLVESDNIQFLQCRFHY